MEEAEVGLSLRVWSVFVEEVAGLLVAAAVAPEKPVPSYVVEVE